MPRQRQRTGPKRVARDLDKIADVFVTIDKTVAERAKKTAQAQNVNLWEVVEHALRVALPPEAPEDVQPALIDLPASTARKAS
ncbi:hypothetical protein [Nocardia tengchongensis]|uniref:hypothetical protein n=1 Tax=Nocardia tengchongensis TaxID=2055889 RepID=UPI00361FB115